MSFTHGRSGSPSRTGALRRSLVAGIGAAASLIALAGPAEAAPKQPDLAVKTVKAVPRVVSPGDELTAKGRVRNSGAESGRGVVEVFLSETQQARPGGTELGGDRVTVAPHSGASFEVTGSVGDELAEYDEGSDQNRYYAVACIPRRGDSGPARCAVAERPTRVRPFSPGGRSLGDPLFPQVGNRGYDVTHYDISIAYDPGDGTPGEHSFEDGTSTIVDAVATKNLSEFSLDFQPYDVSQVLVNGEPAEFEYADTEPLGDPQVVTQLKKLVITPAEGIVDGEEMEVQVDYTGTPEEMTDADESIEGFIQACYTPTSGSRTCDGAFSVNEPNGTQSWAPVNNYPTDKATVDTEITVPTGKTALGPGELAGGAASDNGDGTETWTWSHEVPTSTYLYFATVGDFDYAETQMTEVDTGRVLPIYTAIDSSATQLQKDTITATFGQIPAVTNYLSRNLFGAYPYDSTGGVADRTDNVFYALENATKPHYAGRNSGPSVSPGTQVHEIAHQWMGDSVGPQDWLVIGFNEGWATYAELVYDEANGGDDPIVFADGYYNDPSTDWSLAPADLDGDPANLFASPTYDRTATMIVYQREIMGDRKFLNFATEIAQGYAEDNISWEEYIDEAVELSQFGDAKAELFREFFDQWLYGEERPDLTPEDFEGLR